MGLQAMALAFASFAAAPSGPAPAPGAAPACPLQLPAPTAPAPLTRVPGKAPPPRVVQGPLAASASGGDEQYLAGLRMRRQVDRSWKVFDLAGRHVARIAPDGSIHFEGPRAPYRPAGPVALRDPADHDCMTRSNCHRTGGPAAQTDPLAALGGSLLWSGLVALANTRVSKKVEVNSKTRPEIERATLRFRVDVAREHHLAMYCDRLFDLQRDLNRAWSLPEPQHRKRRVFALFDDANGRFPVPGARVPAMAMADLGSMRNEAITAARRLVVLFVNARFPKGSRHGYSRRELRALNRARKGSVAFSPYAASPG